MPKKISLFSLVLLIIAAIDSIRNLPASALFGAPLIFFFIFAAIIFLIPTALIAAELTASFPESGGIYHWVRMAFGEKMAMLAIWLQWINTMVWYPTILTFIAATASFLIDPALSSSVHYQVGAILVIFWALTCINLFGLNTSAKINSICAILGTMIPMGVLIIFGILWMFSGKPMVISITPSSIFPSLSEIGNWISLTAIMASFLGMELSGVHVNEIHNPQKNFPKALGFSAFFILLTMLLGSLSIAIIFPSSEINLVSGVMHAFEFFVPKSFHSWLTPLLILAVLLGTTGSIINWLISPAKGLLHASEFGYLPPFFAKKNAYGVPSRILVAQAVLVSLICLLFLLVPSVNGFYWFLTALSTQIYMFMYIMMFFSALLLHYKKKQRPPSFKIPFGSVGIWITCLLGLFGALLTIFVGFFPPETLRIATYGEYALMIACGNLLMMAPVLLFFRYKKRNEPSI